MNRWIGSRVWILAVPIYGEHRALSQVKITVFDVCSINDLDDILKEAERLSEYCKLVALVPKDLKLENRFAELIPEDFLLAYSVPTKYGGTKIACSSFDRPVHLLGGRPDVQRQLAEQLNVVSIDCNRFGKRDNCSPFSMVDIAPLRFCLLVQ